MQQRVGNCCSNPHCRCLTTGPNHNPEKATNIGVAAHITAASENGPRYDASLSSEDRSSILNGIWLCQNCSKLIDSDQNTYTVGLIQRWKAHSEEMTRLSIEGRELKPDQQYEGYFCPHCDTFCKTGVSVCLGCNSDIYYGSTPAAWRQDVQIGMMTSALLYIAILLFLPDYLNSQINTSFPLFLGLPFMVFFITGATITILSGIWFAKKKDTERRSNPPLFVRGRH